MEALLEKLSLFLRHTQLETPQLRWVFIPTQGQHTALDIRSSECHNNPKRWLEQSQLKLDQMTFEDLIEGIQLEACELAPGATPDQDLFLESKHQEPLSQLIDRLRSRLGFQSVTHIYERAEHLPEFCSYADPNQLTTEADDASTRNRPFWLLTAPQPISQRGNQLYWMDALILSKDLSGSRITGGVSPLVGTITLPRQAVGSLFGSFKIVTAAVGFCTVYSIDMT